MVKNKYKRTNDVANNMAGEVAEQKRSNNNKYYFSAFKYRYKRDILYYVSYLGIDLSI